MHCPDLLEKRSRGKLEFFGTELSRAAGLVTFAASVSTAAELLLLLLLFLFFDRFCFFRFLPFNARFLTKPGSLLLLLQLSALALVFGLSDRLTGLESDFFSATMTTSLSAGTRD